MSWASKHPPVSWKWGWFPLPSQLHLPAPPWPGFQGISGTHPGRHWLEASGLWRERLLGLRQFYKKQGDPKRKFQRHTGLIHQLPNPILPKFLLSVADRPQKSLELVLHDHGGCNEGEFTPALETGAGEEELQGSARLSALTQFYYTSQPSEVFEIPASQGCREKRVCWFYYLYWQPSYLLQKQPQTHTNSEKHNKIEQ